jgi:hypothetical protein
MLRSKQSEGCEPGRLSGHQQTGHSRRRCALLPRVQHLPPEGRKRSSGQHRAADRIREDPRARKADPRLRHRMENSRFTAPVEEVEGTVESVSPAGITLKEFPGRRFQFSSVGMSAADMSARILGEQNNLTRSLRPAGNKKPRARAREGQPDEKTAHLRDFSRAFLGSSPKMEQLQKSCVTYPRNRNRLRDIKRVGKLFPHP